MRHSSLQLDAAGSLSALSIISFGPGSAEGEAVAERLRTLCSSCTVRAQRRTVRCWQVDWVFEQGNPLPVYRGAKEAAEGEEEGGRRALIVSRIYQMARIEALNEVVADIQKDWRALCNMHATCAELEGKKR